ncbi:MAG: type II secretion system protein GspE, partial [Thermodesulfobacteriota bacterium]|nr:type II secretion system protein GspE [Thermodesulfobacteriota bacterium]
MEHRLIGEILTETCGLSHEALEEALEVQEQKDGRIGEVLMDKKAVSEADLLKGLGMQFGLSFWPSLPTEDLKTDFPHKVSIQFLKKYKMVPVFKEEESFIAVNDPLAFQPLDDLRLALGWNGVETVLAPSVAILSAINLAYDMSSDSAE